ncbi:5-bromo-4-chloroindolyl phosphate hydrolysis family protein [Desulfovibrio sp. OttesenSCG-928-G15]|nr:5-bromo-4-chloroindolyl phosphate hydrolysis family protein [Desulfovibrio sp. OttesenSCG-928-G15]
MSFFLRVLLGIAFFAVVAAVLYRGKKSARGAGKVRRRGAKSALIPGSSPFGHLFFVHSLSLGAACMLAALGAPSGLYAECAFLAYLGLVFLIPQSYVPSVPGLMPTAAGLCLFVLWIVLSAHAIIALFFGGLLCFALSLARDMLYCGVSPPSKDGRSNGKKKTPSSVGKARPGSLRTLNPFYKQTRPFVPKPGKSWAALIVLAAGLVVYATRTAPLTEAEFPTPFWSLPLLFLTAFSILYAHRRLRSDGDQRAELARASGRLEKKLENGTIPQALAPSVRHMLELGRSLAGAPFRLGRDTEDLVLQYTRLTDEIVRLGKHFGARKRRFLADAASDMNLALHTRLRGHAPTERELAEDALKEYARSAAELWQKARCMPRPVQGHILAVCDATDSILRSLREQETAFSGSHHRFLARYLKAAHLILDRQSRFLAQEGGHKNISKVLDRSKAVLANLESTFRQEQLRLLHSDADDFNAELKTLNTLMQMDGAPTAPAQEVESGVLSRPPAQP